MAKTPILDLNTLTERPKIKIDGKLFELLTADELSILDSHWFSERGRLIQKLAGESDQQALEDTVSEVAKRCIVDCPGEVFERLSGTQKMEISEVFTRLLLQRKLQTVGAIGSLVQKSLQKARTGAKSSHASSASSAETRIGGSEKPPAHS